MMSRLRRISRILPAFLTPLLLTLSFPKFDFALLGWIALVPLLLVVKGLRCFKSFALSWVIGVLSFMGIFAWINQVNRFTILHYLLTGLYLGIYFGFFGLFIHIFDHADALYPLFITLIWVCLEYLRSNFYFLAFPWALMGHTQYKNINLIQISSFTGVYGISFLVVLVNALCAGLLEQIFFKPRKMLENKRGFCNLSMCLYLFTFLFVTFLMVWGKRLQKDSNNAGKIKVGLVQGNIPQEIKWKKEAFSRSIELYENLSRKVALDRPSLIIWPETSVPIDLRSYPRQMWRIFGLARQIKIPLICGAAGSAKIGRSEGSPGGIYNSAFYISDSGNMTGEYRKIRLLPFGEYLPSIGGFSLERFFPELRSRFMPGEDIKIFPLNEKAFGVTICWENIFPDLFRKFVLHGASFMVNISNDAWFKNSAGPYQHLMCNIFRAAENRISIARAANTGISCFINPFGKIIRKVTDDKQQSLNIEGVASEDLPLFLGPTFYTKYGDVFVFLCMSLLCLGLIMQLIKILIMRRVREKFRRH